MSLIFEYGQRREDEGKKEGFKEALLCFIKSGVSLRELSQKTGKSVEELQAILEN